MPSQDARTQGCKDWGTGAGLARSQGSAAAAIAITQGRSVKETPGGDWPPAPRTALRLFARARPHAPRARERASPVRSGAQAHTRARSQSRTERTMEPERQLTGVERAVPCPPFATLGPPIGDAIASAPSTVQTRMAPSPRHRRPRHTGTEPRRGGAGGARWAMGHGPGRQAGGTRRTALGRSDRLPRARAVRAARRVGGLAPPTARRGRVRRRHWALPLSPLLVSASLRLLVSVSPRLCVSSACARVGGGRGRSDRRGAVTLVGGGPCHRATVGRGPWAVTRWRGRRRLFACARQVRRCTRAHTGAHPRSRRPGDPATQQQAAGSSSAAPARCVRCAAAPPLALSG